MAIPSDLRHKHTGHWWDWDRISYNNLKDVPASAATTQFAHWNLAVTSWAWTHVVTWTWFTPKFIQFWAVGQAASASSEYSWSYSFWSYHVANDTNSAAAIFEASSDAGVTTSATANASSTTRCYSLQRDATAQENANWHVSAAGSDWFTITKDSSTFSCILHWTAFW
jgi:uncharacterized membrane-anchored protein